MNDNRVRAVVICGSLNRAGAEIIQAAQEEWKRGRMVYAPVSQPDIPAEEHDLRHRVQMLAADEIVVAVGSDGRIGDHTASEIAFAVEHGKPVRYYQPRLIRGES